jgi:hypothetical protein
MFGRKRTQAVDATADPLAHVDPAAVPRRYAGHVAAALEARCLWQELTGSMRAGAVQERLAGLGEQVDDGVLAVWATVLRMGEIERVIATLDLDRVTGELKRVRRDPAATPAMVEALSARFVSVQRMMNAVDDAHAGLHVLDARLGAAVARAAEVALTAGGGPVTPGDDLAAVVTELSALRAALDELG